MIHGYSREFIEFALKNKALLFGEFTLKSGRVSPYFFNTGCFNTGATIARLGQFYARAIVASGVDFDMLFGLAYKGIPLVTSVAVALAEHHGISKPYAFDRKEVKDHGEGGMIVGAPLVGKVLVIDDVITAGVSIEHGASLIQSAGATMAGIVISMDRQERMQHGEFSAVVEVERKYQAPVMSVAKLADLLIYLKQNRHQADNLAHVHAYNETYGAKQLTVNN